MPRHTETRFIPYTDEQMFALVADVERYPEFLPWCVGTRIRDRTDTAFTADLIAAFGAFREKYTSRVNLDPAGRLIVIDYIEGPFRSLSNRWHFAARDNGCDVHFDIEFSFRSRTLENLISGMFTRAVQKMTASFEARAHDLYGRVQPEPVPVNPEPAP